MAAYLSLYLLLLLAPPLAVQRPGAQAATQQQATANVPEQKAPEGEYSAQATSMSQPVPIPEIWRWCKEEPKMFKVSIHGSQGQR